MSTSINPKNFCDYFVNNVCESLESHYLNQINANKRTIYMQKDEIEKLKRSNSRLEISNDCLKRRVELNRSLWWDILEPLSLILIYSLWGAGMLYVANRV